MKTKIRIIWGIHLNIIIMQCSVTCFSQLTWKSNLKCQEDNKVGFRGQFSVSWDLEVNLECGWDWCFEVLGRRTDVDGWTPSFSDPEVEAPAQGECLLASGSRDRTIRLWSISKGRGLLTLKVGTPGMPGHRRDRYDNSQKVRLWMTLIWHRGQPNHIISSSQS